MKEMMRKVANYVLTVALLTVPAGVAFARGGSDDSSSSSTVTNSTTVDTHSGTSGSESESTSSSGSGGSSTPRPVTSSGKSEDSSVGGSGSSGSGKSTAVSHVEDNGAATEALEVATKTTGKKVVLKSKAGKLLAEVKEADGHEAETEVVKPVTTTVKDGDGVARQVKISRSGDKLEVEQDGVEAETDLDVEVNEATDELSVLTSSGTLPVKHLPAEVSQVLIDKGVLSTVDQVKLSEANGEVGVVVAGQKKVALFGFLPMTANETATVSANTGLTISSQKPWFLNILGFLFKK